jgi:TonB-linked SusC/RagA family outer membrane protein
MSLFAQQRQIKGTVKDDKGEAIIGATIVVKGTTTGTTSDLDGNFTLNVSSTAKAIVVSYVGMDKKEVELKSNTVVVVLKDNAIALNEVVAIGYGTQRKKDLTGSVASVSEKALKDLPVATVGEALTGKLPGVQVTTTEGSPDADIKIRVRGGGSITQNNTPLYIVDGFARDDIKDIAPSEIQSIDVLKDASSTAIYGSRGANGVIIVTTKSGQAGKLKINYTGYLGFKNLAKKLDVLTPYEYARKQYERAVWNNSVASDYEKYFGSFDDINLYNYMHGTDWQDMTFGRTGITQSHSLSLNGGAQWLTYNAAYNRLQDKAIMYMSNYHRDNGNIKLNLNPIKWMKIDLGARYTQTVVNGPGANDVSTGEKSTSDSRVKSALVYTPIKLKNLIADSDDSDGSSSLYSPLEMTSDNNRYQKTNDFKTNGGITLTFLKHITLHSDVQWAKTDNVNKQFYGLSSYYVLQGGAMKLNNAPAPAIIVTNNHTTVFQNSNTINYKNQGFAKDHHMNVVLGQETYLKKVHRLTDDIEAFPANYDSFTAWANTGDGTAKTPNDYYFPDEKLISFFGRLNYDIMDKYLLALTFRADGSSKFASGHQWGYFPSASAGWRISDESFMKRSQRWLSNLKLRLSYGTSGNNNINVAAFQRSYTAMSSSAYYLSTISTFAGQAMTAGSIMPNPDLQWETTVTRNLGVDFGFFNNRVSGSIEVYNNNTKKLLLLYQLSGPYPNQWKNAGSTSNKGGEFSLNATLIQNKDFSLNAAFNISINRNKVTSLGELSSISFNEAWTSWSQASNSYIVTPGQPVGLIYGFVSDGMYPADDFSWNGSKWVMNANKYPTTETLTDGTKIHKDANGRIFVDNNTIDGLSWGPGAMKLKDMNGDGKITDADRTVIGNTNPKHYGSFTISGTYKNFDASVSCNWVYGNKIYNATKIETTSGYYRYRNMLSIMNNSYTQIDWTTGNRVTDAATLTSMNANASIWAAPTGNYAVTSWAVEDGSFLRLNNITLGYSLPHKLVQKLSIQQIRIYGTASNIFTITGYTGYDPEVDTRRSSPATPGVDYSAYPKSHSYNIGINITF